MSIHQQALPPAEIEIRYATTGDADGIAALFGRVYHGGYHLAECTDPDLVRRTVASPGHLWVLALAAGTVIGSFAARPDPGTARYELCWGAVDAGYRGRADVGAAAKLLGRDTVSRPDCELLYVKARSEISAGNARGSCRDAAVALRAVGGRRP